MEKLYTTEEVAEILKVSPRTIRREREDANLNFIRIRGQIRYREVDIRKYLEENSWEEKVKLGAE
jgi:excisionase family DNA binding protein